MAALSRTPSLNATLHRLRDYAATAAERARVPYSHQPEGAALLLADGRVVPGTRVESSAFPLTVPAATAARCVAQSVGQGADVVAAAFSGPVPIDAAPLVDDLGLVGLDGVPFALVRPGVVLPEVHGWADPFLSSPPIQTTADGIRLARQVAARARVPLSSFPVGCAGHLPDGRLVGAANVEVSDWTRGLCAERSLVALVASYALPAPATLYLTCLKASCTPCGGCRQVLLDQFPHAVLWMDRGDAPPERTSPAALLPGGFAGEGL